MEQKKSVLDITARPNYNIWICLIFLCAFGALMVYSASGYEAAMSEDCDYNSMYWTQRQIIFMLLGFAFMFAYQFLNYNLLYKIPHIIYIAGIVCILLLKTKYGITVNGATRWLRLPGGIQFQVAELVKLTVIIYLAYLIRRYAKKLGRFWLTVAAWAAGGLAGVLLLEISNDLSSALVVIGITYGVTLICTRTMKLHLLSLAGAVSAAAVYVLRIKNNLPSPEELEKMSFRVGRIAAWIAPEKYAADQGYQVLQSLYAIGRGGLFGSGLGGSLQKFSIPEAQNDMIFAVICEELGLFGAAVMMFLFAYLMYQIMRTVMTADNLYGSVLCLGVFFHIGIQVIVNVAVATNFFPNTGLALPFISYGGTAVFIQMAEIAIVLSVERRTFCKRLRRRL